MAFWPFVALFLVESNAVKIVDMTAKLQASVGQISSHTTICR